MVSAPVSVTLPVEGGVSGVAQAMLPGMGIDENWLLWKVEPWLGPVPLHWSFVASVTPAEPVQSWLLKNAQLPGPHVAVGGAHAQLPQPRVSLRVPTLCGVEYGAGHAMFAPPWWTHDVKPVGTSAHTCVPVHPPPKVVSPLQTSPCVAPVAGWGTDAVTPHMPPAGGGCAASTNASTERFWGMQAPPLAG